MASTRYASILMLCLAAWCGVSSAYIYHKPDLVLSGRSAQGDWGSHIYVLQEGPMYSLADSPFGDQEAFIRLTGEVHSTAPTTQSQTSVLNIVRLTGLHKPERPSSQQFCLCCSFFFWFAYMLFNIYISWIELVFSYTVLCLTSFLSVV